MQHQPEGWAKRAGGALVLLVGIAIGARVVLGLLSPLIPGLIAMVLLAGIAWFLFRRH